MDNPRKSGTAAFVQASPEDAVDQAFKDTFPEAAARALASTARRDASGKALADLRGSFSAHVIRSATDANGLNGAKLSAFIGTPKLRSALAQVFDKEDLTRIAIIGKELEKLAKSQTAQPSIGPLSDRPTNRLLDMAARIVAARHGASMGGGGAASLQTAQMASSRMRETCQPTRSRQSQTVFRAPLTMLLI